MDAARRLEPLRNEKGVSLVLVALCILVLIGFLGLAVDMGHLQAVRGELQNSADAVALAGAGSLYTKAPGALPVLDWNQAKTQATLFVGKNKSDNIALSGGEIVYGFWNIAAKTWEAGSPVSAGAPQAPLTPPGVTAVAATVKREGASNGGEVSTFFMQALGIDKTPVSSRQAVAMSGFPGAVPPATLFPMALTKCMTDSIFSQPPASWPNPINIDSAYGGAGSTCYSGQWTSFKLDKNDVPTINDLITHGNPDPLHTGEPIWI
jgi:Flp pilus assembly protein TadG